MPSGLMSDRSPLPAPDKAVATEENTHTPNASTELKNAKVWSRRISLASWEKREHAD